MSLTTKEDLAKCNESNKIEDFQQFLTIREKTGSEPEMSPRARLARGFPPQHASSSINHVDLSGSVFFFAAIHILHSGRANILFELPMTHDDLRGK